MDMSPESRYRQLGRLIETMPAFSVSDPFTPDQHRWVGLADALVMQCGDLTDRTDWRAASHGLRTANRFWALESIRNVLYRLMAAAELNSPAGVQGAFIPVGNSFDAFAALTKIMTTALHDVLIVDPYMDESALTEFGCTVSEGVNLRLLADQANCKPSLQPAAVNWLEQYGSVRPLAVRLAPVRSLHDRAVFIDGTQAWTLTQSLKDFAKRSPAEIVRANDTAEMKIAAYEAIWTSSTVVV